MNDLNKYFNEKNSFQRILKHKHMTLTNYMTAKSRRDKLRDIINKYNLNNSIVPAIQEEVLFRLGSLKNWEFEMLIKDTLSDGNIIDVYNNSCNKIYNAVW